MLAIKAFVKAFKAPQEAEDFVNGTSAKRPLKSDPSHLQLLSMLQQSGRLLDFFKEDLSSFSDAQVGAAARKIHQECAKLLEEKVTVRPLREEQEGAAVQIPPGYDPSLWKIVGNIQGKPPYTGTLVHKGWKAHKHSLPASAEPAGDILCPAEVEIR